MYLAKLKVAAASLLVVSASSGAMAESKFTIGKDTTYVSGPVDVKGNVDYETALNERLGKDIAPQNNANVLLWSALQPQPKRFPMPPEFFRWLKVPAPDRGDPFVDLNRYAGDTLKLADAEIVALRQERERAAQQPWVAKDYPRIAGWLAANDKQLGLVAEAVRRPEYYNPLVSNKSGPEGWYGLLGALLPAAVKSQREVAPALAARAMLRAGQGKLDEARQDLLVCHRLGRLIARGADHDEFLLGAAIDQLAGEAELALLDRAHPTGKQAKAWFGELKNLPPMSSLADKVDVGTRYTFLDTVMLVRRGPVKTLRFLQILQGEPRVWLKTADPEVPQAVIDALDWNAILRAGNNWYDRTATALRLPDRSARDKELGRLEAELAARKKDAGAEVSVIEAMRRAGKIDDAVSRNLGVVLLNYFQRDVRRMKRAADQADQVHQKLYRAFSQVTS